MRIAHLILTHKNPAQLERLIEAMTYPAFDLYVHLDKKVDIRPFRYLAEKKNVFFIANRATVYWAGYGTIQATINGFKEILEKDGYDYINVISAQDFPLKPPADIYHYIANRRGTEFITCESIEDEWINAAPGYKNTTSSTGASPANTCSRILLITSPDRGSFPYPTINW